MIATAAAPVRALGASLPSTSRALWYLTRGTGAVALLLLTTSVVMGIAHFTRWTPRRTPRFVVQDLHRNVSLLVVVFIAIHVATAVIDGFAPVRWIDAVLPFASAYRPIWLGLGAVAFDLLVAVAVTSLVRARLGYRSWRAVHASAYVCWVVAVVHGLGIGSDARHLWMLGLVAASVGAVGVATAVRVAASGPVWTRPRIALAGSLAVVPLALVGWMAIGPLRAGWARTAGTPTRLLGASAAGANGADAAAAVSTSAPLVLPSAAPLSGSVTVSSPTPRGQVTMIADGRTSRGPQLVLHITLRGTLVGTEGVSVRSGSVVIRPPDGAAVYSGPLTGLSGDVLSAALADAYGDRIGLTVAMSIAPSGALKGNLAMRPQRTGTV